MNQLLMKLLICLTVVSNASLAQEVVLIEKGTPAPYRGVLMTEDKAKVIYNQLADCDKCKLLNKSLEESIQLYQKNESLYLKEIVEVRDQNVILQSALENSKSTNFWEKALWFGFGIITTSVVVFATAQRH